MSATTTLVHMCDFLLWSFWIVYTSISHSTNSGKSRLWWDMIWQYDSNDFHAIYKKTNICIGIWCILEFWTSVHGFKCLVLPCQVDIWTCPPTTTSPNYWDTYLAIVWKLCQSIILSHCKIKFYFTALTRISVTLKHWCVLSVYICLGFLNTKLSWTILKNIDLSSE